MKEERANIDIERHLWSVRVGGGDQTRCPYDQRRMKDPKGLVRDL